MNIAIVGPESSGKTTLIQGLAKLFKAEIIPEFAREYLQNIKINYEFEDLEKIAKIQFNQIKNSKENSLNLIDTDLISLKIWSEIKYGKCSNFILENCFKQGIDFYFLCTPDIPWEFDELRENPNDRNKLFEIFKMELKGTEFYEVKGLLQNRLQFCKEIIHKKRNSNH